MTKKAMKQMNEVIESIGGRFCTVTHTRRGKTRSYCAKIVGNTSQFMTIVDINSDEVRKMNKSAISEIASGQTVFSV